MFECRIAVVDQAWYFVFEYEYEAVSFYRNAGCSYMAGDYICSFGGGINNAVRIR